MIQPFLIALQFLTQFPVRATTKLSNKDVGRSIVYYPLVGLLIGLMLAALSWLLSDAPPLVSSALLLILWVFITGGLHLDGLADSADAWIGGFGDEEKTLAIMKDPNCGPAGVVAILLLLLLKFATIHALLIADEWMILILAATLGRTILPLLFLTTPYARPNGLGSILASHLPRQLTIVALVITCALMSMLAGLISLVVLMVIALIFHVFRRIILRRISGTTGDTAGALVEITETSVLLTAVLIMSS